MNEVELFHWQTARAWDWLELTVGDITEESAKWQPPGIANPIAWNYAHTVAWADVDINHTFFGRPPLLAGDWATRLGCDDPIMPDEGKIVAATDWSTLHEYGLAVHRWIVEMVGALSQEQLDREFPMVPEMLGTWTGRQLVDLHCVHHVRMHGGEIACLKGLQGGRGYLGGVDPEA